MATTQGMGSIIQMEKDKPKNKCRKWQLRVSLGKDPKTGKYYQKTRTVNGSYSAAKAALREFIEEIDENFPVIATKYGTRVNPATLSTWRANDRARFGLESFTLHELRHTYLTLLAMNGVHPKVMRELAGHYSSQITMDIYAHVNMDAKREAVAAVSKVF